MGSLSRRHILERSVGGIVGSGSARPGSLRRGRKRREQGGGLSLSRDFWKQSSQILEQAQVLLDLLP